MHEAPDAATPSAETSAGTSADTSADRGAERTSVPGAPVAGAPEADSAESIEALPLAERAPRFQAVADRLRAELEQSDPSRGDA